VPSKNVLEGKMISESKLISSRVFCVNLFCSRKISKDKTFIFAGTILDVKVARVDQVDENKVIYKRHGIAQIWVSGVRAPKIEFFSNGAEIHTISSNYGLAPK